jgi:hypothetical protein
MYPAQQQRHKLKNKDINKKGKKKKIPPRENSSDGNCISSPLL